MFSRVFLRLENAECPILECPILTARFSTLEPAQSGVEGVRFHSRVKFGILLEAGNRTTPKKIVESASAKEVAPRRQTA